MASWHDFWRSKIERLNKHDTYLDELYNELEDKYDALIKNVTLFSRKKRKIAEIDILAVKKDYYDVYEVKCSYRITKATKQLEKIRKILSRNSKVKNTYFFCGASKQLEVV